MVVNAIHEDCWRSPKHPRFTFGATLKIMFGSILVPAKLTSPAVSLLVMLFQPNLLNSKSYWTIALKHVRAA